MNARRVKLTPGEIAAAGAMGSLRQVSAIAKGRPNAHGLDSARDAPWEIHIEGVLAEFAVAKCLNVYWGSLGNLRDYDVGMNCDVRGTKHRNGRLIVHETDPDDRAFWLVRGSCGDYEVCGWIMGRDAKRAEFRADPTGGRPAYFVPADRLQAPEQWQAPREGT